MKLASWWAVAGLVLLFLSAVLRLGGRGIATLRAGLTTGEWVVFLVLTAAFVYGEGILGLARRWVPRAVARSAALQTEPRRDLRVLAPLFAMGLVAPSARGVARPWAGVTAIIAAVLTVSRLPEPWRGIIDFAVAAALAWGVIAIVRQSWFTLRTPTPDHD